MVQVLGLRICSHYQIEISITISAMYLGCVILMVTALMI